MHSVLARMTCSATSVAASRSSLLIIARRITACSFQERTWREGLIGESSVAAPVTQLLQQLAKDPVLAG